MTTENSCTVIFVNAHEMNGMALSRITVCTGGQPLLTVDLLDGQVRGLITMLQASLENMARFGHPLN